MAEAKEPPPLEQEESTLVTDEGWQKDFSEPSWAVLILELGPGVC